MTEAAIAAPAIDPMLPQIARVLHRHRDGPQVWSLEIEPGESSFHAFLPGQFSMLTAFGVGEVPISMSGDPNQPSRLVHTVRAVGPISAALARLEPGENLGVRGPFGTGWPMGEAAGRDVVIVAGGIGLAPLRPVLYRLLAERTRYEKVVLLYGARAPGEILFHSELAAWQRRPDIDIAVTVDHAIGTWHGRVGVVTTLVPQAAFEPRNAIALVCGPEIMMRFVAAALRDAGVADESIYLSMERNMRCAIGSCGHCQLGPLLVCRDGPVVRYDRVRSLLRIKEI